MTRFVMIAALLGLTVACAAASEPSAATPPPAFAASAAAPPPALPPSAAAPEALPAYITPASHTDAVSCAIERVPTLRGVRLEARADGFDPADLLEYEFVVTKRGSGGSSDIMQSGEVSEPFLGAVDFDGGRWRAELTLRDAEGEVCAAELNS